MERMSEQETKILSEEEKRNFSGITIDEATQQEEFSEEETSRVFINQNNFKIYTFNNISWKYKLLILLLAVVGIITLVFLGGFFLVGFLVLAIIGVIVTFLRNIL